MTRRVDAIDKISPCAYVEVHPEDAVKVSSRRGFIQVKISIPDRPSKGAVFITFHFKEAAANVLTHGTPDPVAEIPEFRVCAAGREPVKNKNLIF